MEESNLIPEEIKKNDSLSEISEQLIEDNELIDKPESSPKLDDREKEDEDLEIKSNKKSSLKEESLFNRFLKEGFDGITTNPNYKLLALLVILLINLSLFLIVGNLGKSFLQNSGLLS